MYVKFRFVSDEGATAGVVMAESSYRAASISDLSRLFPYSEARFMRRLEVSPAYDLWDRAFAHDFSGASP